MKTFLISFVLMTVMMLSSCGGQTKNVEQIDSVKVDTIIKPTEIFDSIGVVDTVINIQ